MGSYFIIAIFVMSLKNPGSINDTDVKVINDIPTEVECTRVKNEILRIEKTVVSANCYFKGNKPK